MEDGKRIAKQVLAKLGFQVEEIETGKVRTADFRVTGESIYHVEVKDKLESEEQAEKRRKTLATGELYEQMDPLAYNNRIRGIFRDAREQLNATPKAPGTFQLIWFQATGIDADTKYRQAFATFYGYVHLSPRYPHNHLPTIECFFFDYNAAFDMPDIEALIVCDGKQLQVCVNQHAPRADEFRKSDLARAFGEIYDPAVLEADGNAILCRFDGPRNDENVTRRALQEQTGIDYAPIRLNRYAAHAATGLPSSE
jgi:hypothetical protein